MTAMTVEQAQAVDAARARYNLAREAGATDEQAWHEAFDAALPHLFPELWADAARYQWIESNVSERPTPGSMADSEYAEHKTQWVLPTLIAWADFCGPISFREASAALSFDIAMSIASQEATTDMRAKDTTND